MDEFQFLGFAALFIWLIPSPISWVSAWRKDTKYKKNMKNSKNF